jgi:hypothetical protein
MVDSLAPALGRLAAVGRHARFDPIRLGLVDALVAARAADALDGSVWLKEWQRAMIAIRDQVIGEAMRAMDEAAVRSRFPAARLNLLRPDTEAAATLLHRLLAEGEILEQLEPTATDDATTRARGAALETAWDAAVRIAVAEQGHWSGVARDIAHWRRPWRPLVIGAGITIAAATVLAAMIGGVLPAPAWFQPITNWFWNLPWP